ncbi:MAG: hypothetical protein CME71_04825 [Halobacteriovorax sp.]|mgnify:CR=1 FL=1|nr:hypothetical protein [Halobacteriovorax sp.]
MNIVIFRHGETDWNVEGRLQGSTDIPLNSKGLAQAAQLARTLEHFEFDHIVSSDLSRAYETAAAVARLHKLSVNKDTRLRELGLGQAEGKTLKELELDYGENPLANYEFKGRESKQSLVIRVNQLVVDLASSGFKSVALSSHGGVVWNWLSQFSGAENVGRVHNTDAFELEYIEGKVNYKSRISNNKN